MPSSALPTPKQGVSFTVAAVVAILALGADAVQAFDQGVFGQQLVVKRSASGREKMVLVLKDPALPFPAIGGGDDPSVVGMQVDLIPTNGDPTATFVIPPGLGKPGWKVKEGKRRSYGFANREAPDGLSEVKTAKLKEGKLLKIVAKRTGLALTGPQGGVGVRVTMGSLRVCTLFDASTIQTDEAGRFKARKAEGSLPACDDAILDGVMECGDGFIEAPEECDGVGSCGATMNCREPGFPDECTCTACGSCPGVNGCCGPSIFIPGPGICGGSCLSTTCALPYACGSGTQCLPDETCCAPAGQSCYFAPFAADLLPCCPGTACDRPVPFGAACCVPESGACSFDGQCCSGSCTDGTCDPCLPTGAPCSDSARCCSFYCNAEGVCECASAGSACTDSSQCCSGSCDMPTRTCDSP